MNGPILIAGGAADPQLRRLVKRADELGAPARALLHGPGRSPRLEWRLDDDVLEDQDGPIVAGAAFVRQDVFQIGGARDRATARHWKMLIDGWLAAHPAVARFNRGFLMREAVNKPLALVWARESGLAIPETRMTDCAERARAWLADRPIVYKPVAGGDLCRPLDAAALDRNAGAALPRPYTFQVRLVAPELRVFRVGPRLLSFEVASDALDYRDTGGAPRLTPTETPAEIAEPLMRLTDRLGLDWSAADFKTRAADGALVFLEANSNPMFAAFDIAADGALTAAMIDALSSGGLSHGAAPA